MKTYTSVQDWKNLTPTSPAAKSFRTVVLPDGLNVPSHNKTGTTSVIVAEDFDAIAMSFHISYQNLEYWIGPSQLLTHIILPLKFPRMPRHTWCSKGVSLSEFTIVDGDGLIESNTKGSILHLVGRDISLVVLRSSVVRPAGS